MKTLFLLRHAKSSWDYPDLSDFERPLNKRGKRDAPVMGERLSKKSNLPQLIIASPAVRALTTARIVNKKIGDVKFVTDEGIYGAGVSDMLSIISDLPDAVYSAMLVGHNPTFTYLANELSGSNIDNVPTCAIVTVGFKVNSWDEVVAGAGELIDFDYPKKANATSVLDDKLNC